MEARHLLGDLLEKQDLFCAWTSLDEDGKPLLIGWMKIVEDGKIKQKDFMFTYEIGEWVPYKKQTLAEKLNLKKYEKENS